MAGSQGVWSGVGMIPPDRRIEWKPGIPGGIPDVPLAANVKDFGAKGDGTADDTAALARAINSVREGAILIPEGTYLIRGPLTIGGSVVLRGEGAARTHLIVDHTQGPGIMIAKFQRSPYTAVTGGSTKGSTVLTVADASAFRPNLYVEIQQDNDPVVMYTDPRWNESWAQDTVGHLTKVVAISGNSLTLEEPLRMDLQTRLNPRARALVFVERAGIERLRITRKDRSENHLIVLKYAAYSWVREVESENAYRSHILVDSAYRCEIRENYIHHAGDYGGGGHGYGVTLEYRTNNCLIENNIFRSLRHAMLIHLGVFGNVFGYNFSVENLRSDGPAREIADISLHGHYPYFNLFEGNVVQDVHISDFWGPSGPGNTIFRNRVESGIQPDRRGIRISDQSHRQNIVGNEILFGSLVIDRGIRETLSHGNLVRGTLVWDQSVADRDLPASYYLTSRPAFYGSMAWPSVGADRPNGMNPAKQRFLSGSIFQKP